MESGDAEPANQYISARSTSSFIVLKTVGKVSCFMRLARPLVLYSRTVPVHYLSFP